MAALRAGIIGCGNIAQVHALGYQVTDGIELVAAAEVIPDRLHEFGAKWGVERRYSSYLEMLERERLDVVSICTRHDRHVEPTIAAAEAGAKAVLSEKPMARSLGEADAAIDACDRAGTLLCIDHTMRFERNYQQIKRLIDAGEIGELLCVSVLALGDLGELIFNATHSFDTLRMFGGDAVWILPDLQRRVERMNDREDLYAIVQHASGVRGILQYGGYTGYRYEGFVFEGTRGRIETVSVRGWVPDIRIWQHQVGEPVGVREGKPLPSIANDPFAGAVAEIVECVSTGRPCVSDGRSGRAALELVLACYEATRRSNPRITLPLEIAESTIDLALAEGRIPRIWGRGLRQMT
jgi:predicted dehydrogenase